MRFNLGIAILKRAGNALAFLCLLFYSAFLASSSAQATSQTIRIDGNVYTAAGAPVTGTRNIIIKAYAAASGGAALWTSTTFTNTTVTNGRFSVSLDASSGLTQAWSDASGSLWFEITVGSDVVKPRFQAKGSMFAVAAATADRIRNYSVSTLAPTTGDVLTWNGSAWAPAAASGAGGSYVAKAGDTMTGALSLTAGSGGAPSLNWGDTGTGFYRPAASSVALSINGVQRLLIGTASTSISNPIGAYVNGDQSSPSYGFQGAWNTGLFPISGGLGITSGGTERMRLTTAGAILFPGMTADRALYLNSSTQLTTSAVTGTQLGYLSNVTADVQSQINNLNASAGNGTFVHVAGDTMTGSLQTVAGTASSPALQVGETNTGIYLSSAGTIAIAASGATLLRLSTAGGVAAPGNISAGSLVSGNYLRSGNATASVPGIAFSNDTTTGLFMPSTGMLGFSTAGVERLRITSAGQFYFPGAVADRALYLNTSSQLAGSSTTGTELSYLSGVTAPVQTQINNLNANVGNGTFVHLAGDTMTGALTLPAGSVSAPSLTLGDTGTGIYRGTANEIDIAVAGTKIIGITASGVNVSGPVTTNQWVSATGGFTTSAGNFVSSTMGTAALPTFRLNNGGGVAGLYQPNAGDLGLATGTALRLNITSAGVINIPGLTASRALTTDGSSNLVVSNATSTELGYLSGVTAAIQTQINNLASNDSANYVAKAGDTMTGALTLPNGSLGAQALNIGDSLTGFYRNTSDGSLRIVSGGSSRLSLTSAGAIYMGFSGSATFPALVFSNNGAGLESGIFSSSMNDIGISTADVERIRFTSAGSILFPGMTADRALYLNSSTQLATSAVTGTQLGYLSNVTGDVQSQINNITTGGSFVAKAGDTMTGPLTGTVVYLGNGSAANPALSFNSQQDLGFYKVSNGIGMSAGGSNKITFTTSGGISATGTLSTSTYVQAGWYLGTGNGSVGSPVYRPGSNTSSGMYAASAGDVSLSTGGALRFNITSAGAINVPGLAASAVLVTDTASNLVASGTTSTELGYVSGVTAAIQTQINNLSSNGAASYVAKAGDTMTGALVFPVGAVATPSINFGDTGTGFYRSASGEVSFSSAGGQKIKFNSGGIAISSGSLYSNSGALIESGTVSVPAVRFNTGLKNFGVYSPNVGDVAIATSGALRLNVTSAGPINIPDLTASRALVTDGSSNLAVSNTTSTELGYLSGVTGALQTQINNIVSGGSFVAKAGDTMTGPLSVPIGTSSAPGLQFANSTGPAGLYMDTVSGNIIVRGNSTGRIYFSPSGRLLIGTYNYLSSSFPTISLNSASDSASGAIGLAAFNGGYDLALITGATNRLTISSAGAISIPGLTAGNAIYMNSSSQLTSSSVTGTELGYLSGVTAPIQTQINNVVSGGTFVAKAGDTMTGPLTGTAVYLADGTTASPSHSFSASTNTGVYRDSTSGSLKFSIGGAVRFTIQSTGGVTTYSGSSWSDVYAGKFQAASAGSAANPAFMPNDGISGTGLYFPAGGSSAISSGGVMRMQFTSAGAIVIPGFTAGNALYLDSSTQLASSNTTSTELGYLSGVTAGVQTQINSMLGSAGTFLQKSGGVMTGTLQLAAGSVTAPTLTFGTTNTGLYRSGGDGVGLVVDGTQILYVNSGWTGGLTIPVALSVNQNTTSAKFLASTTAATSAFPAVSIGTVSNSGGLYAPATGDLGLASGGSLRMNFTSAGAINIPGMTASRALTTDGSSNLAVSNTTSTELGYLSGVTAPIQTQINTLSSGGAYVAKTGDTMTGTLVGTTIQVAAGALSAPALSVGQADTGFYLSAPGVLSFVAAGTERLRIGTGANGTVTMANSVSIGGTVNTGGVSVSSYGSNSSPAYRFVGKNAGMYMDGSAQVILANGSADRLTVTTGGSIIINNLSANKLVLTDASSGLTSSTSAVTDTQLGYLAGVTGAIQTQINNLNAGTSGAAVLRAGDSMTGQLRGPAAGSSNGGTATSPAYSFSGDSTTGIYSPAASGVNVTVAGSDRIAISTAAANFSVPITSTISGVTTTTADFVATNLVSSSATCGAITLSNLQTGGTYSLIMTSPGTGTCSFTAAGRTVTAPPIPAATSTAMVFTFLVTSSTVYVNYTKY